MNCAALTVLHFMYLRLPVQHLTKITGEVAHGN